MAGLKQLIQEVHRRSLWQVLLIYIAASWAVLEAADVMVSRLALPEWVYGAAIVLLLVGLPIVLATAFVQEGVTPSRPEPPGGADDPAKTGTRPHEATGVRRLFTWRNAMSGGVLALALWGVIAAGWLFFNPKLGKETIEAVAERRQSVAVLPFRNLSPDPADAYFADGIHDEIIGQLGKIASLKVISRTSVMEYRDQTRNLREIAEELGVTNILEGTVRREGDRVRITTQLIDAKDDAHLWAEIYERDLASTFAVQAELAQTVASVLEAVLTPQEVERIQAKPTDNSQAYEQFIRGREYLRRSYQEGDLRIAAQMFSEVVELDPDFAAAYALMSITHSRIHWQGYDRTEDRLTQAREAAETAFRLEPDLPDAHHALGTFYYYALRNYEKALGAFSTALQLQPNNSDVLATTAYVQRRLGEWVLALDNLKRAFELDPRSPIKAEQVAITATFMRKFSEAAHYNDIAISLSPETTQLYHNRAAIILAATGDSEEALRAIEEAPEMDVSQLPSDNAHRLWRLFFIAGKYERPLREINVRTVGDDTTLYFLTKAELYQLMGQTEASHAYYDSARMALESLRLQGRGTGPFFNLHCRLGLAYAALGRNDDALHEGAACVEDLPLSGDAMISSYNLRRRAQIYAMAGEPDSAIAQLAYLLSIPSHQITVARLRVDPSWNPLRSHPRFQALLEQYEQ